jgi:5-dehydro-2-deoxygluconokinase
MDELLAFVRRSPELRRPDDNPEVRRLHRLLQRQGVRDELLVMAFDHRAQLEAMADKAGAERSRLAPLKTLLGKAAFAAAERGAFLPKLGIIADDRYGADALAAATGKQVWVARPVEVPQVGVARPQLAFESGPEVGPRLRTWPQEQIIKCLVFLNPDAMDNEVAQLERMLQLQRAGEETGNPLLFEVIPFGAGTKMDAGRLPAMLEWLYGRGVRPDWWKLPPLPNRAAWDALEAVIHQHDPHCCGVLLLGLEAPEEVLAESFRVAAPSKLVKGFAVGRTLFAGAASEWLAGRIGDDQLVDQVTNAFSRLAQAWRKVRP